MKLVEVAKIFQGLTNKQTGKKRMNYIRVKRLNSFEPLTWEWFETVKGRPLPSRYYLLQNDILITSIIHHKKPKVVLYNLPDPDVICQSNTLVIRITSSDFLPEFLLIYLQYFAIEQLKLTGHKNPTIHKISVKSLKDLNLPSLSIEQQQNILQIYELYSVSVENLETKLLKMKEIRLKSLIQELNRYS